VTSIECLLTMTVSFPHLLTALHTTASFAGASIFHFIRHHTSSKTSIPLPPPPPPPPTSRFLNPLNLQHCHIQSVSQPCRSPNPLNHSRYRSSYHSPPPHSSSILTEYHIAAKHIAPSFRLFLGVALATYNGGNYSATSALGVLLTPASAFLAAFKL
jgi:hypothetical protein